MEPSRGKSLGVGPGALADTKLRLSLLIRKAGTYSLETPYKSSHAPLPQPCSKSLEVEEQVQAWRGNRDSREGGAVNKAG